MQRLPTGKYLGTMVTLWGVIVTVTSACKNYGALVTTRVLLGCFESAVAPSLILITGMWYKHNEQPPRVGLWYIGTGSGTILGSLISFGFQHYSSNTFTSWQIMFLVVGLVTVCVGITVILLLPDNPMTSRLTHEEKVWAVQRLRENQTGIENKHVSPTPSQHISNPLIHALVQSGTGSRMLPRPSNLFPRPHYHRLQCTQWSCLQLSSYYHQELRLQ